MLSFVYRAATGFMFTGGPGGGVVSSIRTLIADGNILATDHYVTLDGNAAGVIGTLPAIATVPNKVLIIKAIDLTNACSVDGNGAEQIDWEDDYGFVMKGESITIIADAVAVMWRII